MLADVTHGGAWHIGVLAAPGIPEMLLAGRERAFIADYAIPSLNGTPDAFTDGDIDELARTYARPDGFAGAAGLYRSALAEGDEIRALAGRKLDMPVLAVGGGSGDVHARHDAPGRDRRHGRLARRHRALRRDGGAGALADALVSFLRGVETDQPLSRSAQS